MVFPHNRISCTCWRERYHFPAGCYMQGWKIVLGATRASLRKLSISRNLEEAQNSPSWQDIPLPTVYTNTSLSCLLSHESIRTQSLCSLILFLPVTSRRPDCQITAELSDFDPPVLAKWGLPLWSSSTPSLLFETLSLYPLLLKVINNNVFYVPSPYCYNWNLGCPWNPTFHAAFSGDGYLSLTPIGTEDK